MSFWNVDSGKRSHEGGTKNPLIPIPFGILEAAYLFKRKEKLNKGLSIGFSEVPQHGKLLTGHWNKKIGNNRLKINIRKIDPDRVVFETLIKIIERKTKLDLTASEPRNDKWLRDSHPFYNATSRQSSSTVSCKDTANIRGTNKFYKKKIENMLAIPQNFFCLLIEIQSGV